IGWPVLVALLCAILIQIGTNLANDYFDFIKGGDTPARLGPTRATQAGLISPTAMRNAFVSCFVLAVVLGFSLVIRGGWPIVLVGVLSVAAGIAYTGGPYPLAYLGLGDLFVLIFFGPVAVAGTYYVEALSYSGRAVIAGLIPGLIAVGILAVNNLRDIDEDRSTGKRTLAVRLGPRSVRIEYTAALFLSVFFFTMLLPKADFINGLLLGLLLGVAYFMSRQIWHRSGRDLNPMLGHTAQFLILATVFFLITQLV
ncbi:MAG: 1,4-dihydroxy-2-naphthoate polyprenyltransferase, partial [Candidatus Margulisiibacteriota bacterium]